MSDLAHVDEDETALAYENLLLQDTQENANFIASLSELDPRLQAIAFFKLGKTVHALRACQGKEDEPALAFVLAKIYNRLGNLEAQRQVLQAVIGKQKGAESRLMELRANDRVANVYEELVDLSSTNKQLTFFCSQTSEPWKKENIRFRFEPDHLILEILFATGAVYSHYHHHDWTIVIDQCHVEVSDYVIELTLTTRET
jgi:hypothetical protein